MPQDISAELHLRSQRSIEEDLRTLQTGAAISFRDLIDSTEKSLLRKFGNCARTNF